MVGYSRRGFLGMIAAAMAAPVAAKKATPSLNPILYGVALGDLSDHCTLTIAASPILAVGETILINGCRYRVESARIDSSTGFSYATVDLRSAR